MAAAIPNRAFVVLTLDEYLAAHLMDAAEYDVRADYRAHWKDRLREGLRIGDESIEAELRAELAAEGWTDPFRRGTRAS